MLNLSQNFWKKYFKTYDILNKAIPYQDLLNLVIKKLPQSDKYKILDLGSGTGNLSIKLKKIGYDVYSLDNSQVGLTLHLMKDHAAKIYLYDLNKKLPFEDNYFDIIISLNTICFIDKKNCQKIFNDLYRILKKDGKIIVVNLFIEFHSVEIFLLHIKNYLQIYGFFKMLNELIILAIPIIKMFYFTLKLQKIRKITFFKEYEQQKYLRNAKFINISNNEFVFAKQAILNEANK